MQFYANTGFLFRPLSFHDRLQAAAAAGFDGVECHDEIQHHDIGEIADLLAQTGLHMGSLNIRMGETKGCAALSGHQGQFAQDMAQAARVAQRVGAGAIHVLAGVGDLDQRVFVQNLRRALDSADCMILIEPISARAMQGYALNSLTQALEVCARLDDPRLRVMFDWFHMADILGAPQAARALSAHRTLIGHVQLASHPDRTEPDAALLELVRDAGFGRVGLEYNPTVTEGTLLAQLRRSL